MWTHHLKPTFTKEWDLFSSKKYCLQGLMWPKESSRTLADLCDFRVLFQAPSSHFFPCNVISCIWEGVLQQPHCCLPDEQQAKCGKRYTLEFRKEHFSACSGAHIATWNLCRSWRLFGWFCASLLSLSSPPHQGMLRLLYFAGLQRIWRSPSTPWLSISSQVGKGSGEDCCWLQPLSLCFSCLLWSHTYRVNLELREAWTLGKMNIVEQKKVCI